MFFSLQNCSQNFQQAKRAKTFFCFCMFSIFMMMRTWELSKIGKLSLISSQITKRFFGCTCIHSAFMFLAEKTSELLKWTKTREREKGKVTCFQFKFVYNRNKFTFCVGGGHMYWLMFSLCLNFCIETYLKQNTKKHKTVMSTDVQTFTYCLE